VFTTTPRNFKHKRRLFVALVMCALSTNVG